MSPIFEYPITIREHREINHVIFSGLTRDGVPSTEFYFDCEKVGEEVLHQRYMNGMKVQKSSTSMISHRKLNFFYFQKSNRAQNM